MAEQGNGKAKSKIQIFIEHVDKAREHFTKAAGVALSLAHEMEQHATDVEQYRDSIIGTVAAAGGDTSFPLESEMGKYIPSKYRSADEPSSSQS